MKRKTPLAGLAALGDLDPPTPEEHQRVHQVKRAFDIARVDLRALEFAVEQVSFDQTDCRVAWAEAKRYLKSRGRAEAVASTLLDLDDAEVGQQFSDRNGELDVLQGFFKKCVRLHTMSEPHRRASIVDAETEALPGLMRPRR